MIEYEYKYDKHRDTLEIAHIKVTSQILCGIAMIHTTYDIMMMIIVIIRINTPRYSAMIV